MSAPHKLSRKLQETLGPEASDAMIDWMNQTDIRFDKLDAELAEFRSEVRADFAELRQEIDAKLSTEIGSLREEMRAGFARMDTKFAEMDARFAGTDAKFAGIDGKFDAKFADAQITAAQRHADFMKWTMGFWVVSLATLAGAIIGLSGRLR